MYQKLLTSLAIDKKVNSFLNKNLSSYCSFNNEERLDKITSNLDLLQDSPDRSWSATSGGVLVTLHNQWSSFCSHEVTA